MASSRRTLDVDLITLRQVFIRGQQNSLIPSTSVLVSDGRGGTYWSPVSTVGTFPSFNQYTIDTSNVYRASANSNIFTLNAGPGIGFTDGGSGLNTTYMYAKAFQGITVPGQSTITAFTNGVLTPTLAFSTFGNIAISTDTFNNTLFFNAGLKNINVLSNTSTLTATAGQALNTATLPMTLSLSTLTFAGLGDIYLETDTPTNSIAVGIRGYTAAGWQALSGEVFTLQSTIFGTASTSLVTYDQYSTGFLNLSTTTGLQLSSFAGSNNFSNLSTYVGSNVSTISSQNTIAISSLSTSAYQILSSVSTYTYTSISTLSTYFYQVNQSTLSTFIYNQLASTVFGYSTMYSSTIEYTTSTITTFGGGVTTLSFLSTSASFIANINAVTSNSYSTTQLAISSLSTALFSSMMIQLRNKASIVSSLRYSGSAGSNLKFAFPAGTTITTSTAQLSFAAVASSIASANTDISLEYSPVILFPQATSYYVQPQTVCTILVCDSGKIMSNSLFSDTFIFDQYDQNSQLPLSNLYSKYIRIRLDAREILSNAVDKYTIYHHLPTIQPFIKDLSETANSTLGVLTPSYNSLYLNIFNRD
jgi:hypothetical protein